MSFNSTNLGILMKNYKSQIQHTVVENVNEKYIYIVFHHFS